MLTVGSLFAGVGGFDLGLERAGMRVVWQAESNEFCRGVLAKHWPGVPCYPDVRALVADTNGASGEARGSNGLRGGPGTVAGQPTRSAEASAGGHVPVSVPYVDVLCGGFPCQDLSVAGKGAGIDGSRSGLWGEYARLIRELRPRYVVVENVAALLGRGLGRVLGDLAACGYDAEWDCVPASAVGAPHRRDRLWIVAYPQCGGLEGHRQVGQQEVAWAGRRRASTDSDTDAGRLEVVPQLDSEQTEDSSDGHPRGRHPHGFRDEVADPSRDAEAGPAPQPGTVGERARSGGERGGAGDVGHASSGGRDAAPDPRPGEHQGRGGTGPAGGSSCVGGGEGWWLSEPAVGRVAHGIPNKVDRLAALGNSLVPQIAEWIGRRIVETEEQR